MNVFCKCIVYSEGYLCYDISVSFCVIAQNRRPWTANLTGGFIYGKKNEVYGRQ